MTPSVNNVNYYRDKKSHSPPATSNVESSLLLNQLGLDQRNLNNNNTHQDHGSPNRSPNRDSPWIHTSFRLKKQKPSKVRYLSNSELLGISASILLTFIIAIAAACILVFATPIVLKHLLNFLDDLLYIGDLAKKSYSGTNISRGMSVIGTKKMLHVVENVTEESFIRHRNNGIPLLFNTEEGDVKEMLDFIYEKASKREVQLYHATGNKYYSSFESNTSRFTPLTKITVKTWLSSDFIYDVNVDNIVAVSSNILSRQAEDEEQGMTSSTTCQDTTSSDSLYAKSRMYHYLPNSNAILEFSKNSSKVLSGAPFQVEHDQLSTLLLGRRHWVIFRPDSLPQGGFNPHQNFALHQNSSLLEGTQVYHIQQRVGETVYIPEGWIYSSQSMDENSISLTFVTAQVNPGSYLYYWIQGNERLHQGDFKGAIKVFKLGLSLNRNILLLESMADAMMGNEQFLAAEEFYRECIHLNPRNPLIYSKLINLLINHANQDISHSIAELLDQAQLVGLRDVVLSYTNDAL